MSAINIFDVLPPGFIQDIISGISGDKSALLMYNLTVETRLSVLDLIRLGNKIYTLGVLFYEKVFFGPDYGEQVSGYVKLKGEKIIQASSSVSTILILTNYGNVYDLIITSLGFFQTNITQKRNIVQISTNESPNGRRHSLLLDKNGYVYSFGLSANGQLGLGYTGNFYIPNPTLINPSFFDYQKRKVVQVSAGWLHSLFLCNDNTIYASGTNSSGQCGVDTITTYHVLTPTAINSSNMSDCKIVQVSAGGYHSLFLCEDGSAYISGTYFFDSAEYTIPTKINKTNMGKRKIIQLSAGGHHAVFICEDGTVYSAGNGESGVLGIGTTNDDTIDIPVPIDMSHFNGQTVKSASAGINHSLFLCDDGSIYMCGLSYNENGDENVEDVPVPVDPATYNNKRITGVVAGWRKSFFLA